MHVGDDRPLRFESVDPAQGIVDAEMTGVAVVAEPIDNPQLEIFQRRPALAWNVDEERAREFTGLPPAAIDSR